VPERNAIDAAQPDRGLSFVQQNLARFFIRTFIRASGRVGQTISKIELKWT